MFGSLLHGGQSDSQGETRATAILEPLLSLETGTQLFVNWAYAYQISGTPFPREKHIFALFLVYHRELERGTRRSFSIDKVTQLPFAAKGGRRQLHLPHMPRGKI